MTFSVKALIGVTDRITRPLEDINRTIRQTLEPFERLRRFRINLARGLGLDRLGRSLGRLRSQVAGLVTPLGIGTAGLTAGFGLFTRGVITSSAEVEKFRAMLTSIEGSAEGAEASLAWIREFAATTPLQLTEVTDSFVKLRTFGLDPTDGTMRALVDQMAKTGGGAETLEGIILAVGQAWTKGKLQGEEALQLLERGVPVWDLLAAKTGHSAAALQDMASKGKLGRDAIRVLIQEIGKSSKGAAAEQMKTFNGLVSNLADRWTGFQVAIGDAGFFDSVKTAIGGLLDEIERMAKSGELDALAKNISDGLVAALEGVVSIVREVDFGALITDIRSFVAEIAGFGETIGGWKNALLAVAAVASGPLLGALASVAGVIARIVALLIANPVGLVIAAIAGAAWLIYENWEPIKAWFAELWGEVETYFQGMLDFITGVFTLDSEKAIGGMKAMWSGLTGYFGTLWEGVKGVFGLAASALGMEAEFGRAVATIEEAWAVLPDTFARIWAGITAIFEAAWETVRPIVEALEAAANISLDGIARAAGDAIGLGEDPDGALAIARREAEAVSLTPAAGASVTSPGFGTVPGPASAGAFSNRTSGEVGVEVKVRAEPGTAVTQTRTRTAGNVAANVGRTDGAFGGS